MCARVGSVVELTRRPPPSSLPRPPQHRPSLAKQMDSHLVVNDQPPSALDRSVYDDVAVDGSLSRSTGLGGGSSVLLGVSRSPSSEGSPPRTPNDSSQSEPSPSTGSHSPGRLPSSSTVQRPRAVRKAKPKVADAPVLVPHLQNADDEAAATFTKMTTNHHQFNTLGRSHQDEDAMVCDCNYRPGQSASRSPSFGPPSPPSH